MTPRRNDRDGRDDVEAFDPEFDDDVFAAPAARGGKSPRKPRARKSQPAAPPRRSRRALRVAGIALLAIALIAFVISFVSGLGGSGDGRVTGDAVSAGEELDRIGPRVKVEVLNAGGVAGLARLATEHLRDRGFDVVAFGNAGAFEQDSTVVIARTSDVDAARRVARALGTDSVVVDPDAQLFVDATVRLGKDWPADEVGAPADSGFFGGIRGWFSSE